jgi:hypothetical protein
MMGDAFQHFNRPRHVCSGDGEGRSRGGVVIFQSTPVAADRSRCTRALSVLLQQVRYGKLFHTGIRVSKAGRREKSLGLFGWGAWFAYRGRKGAMGHRPPTSGLAFQQPGEDEEGTQGGVRSIQRTPHVDEMLLPVRIGPQRVNFSIAAFNVNEHDTVPIVTGQKENLSHQSPAEGI